MKSPIDVLLINPAEDFKNIPQKKGFAIYPPLGLMYLCSCLKKNEISTAIIDALAERLTLDSLLIKIKEIHPKIIGITATTPQMRGAVQLAKEIKKKFSDIMICLGGVHVTLDPKVIDRFNFFDFCIVGEGEVTFPMVIRDFLDGKKIKRVYQGIKSFDLDSLPSPDWDSVNRSLYYEPNSNNFVTIHSSRGCPFNCVYCSKPDKSFRCVSPDVMIRHINRYIRKYNIDYILFTDDTFTLRRERVKEFCNKLINNHIKISWGCETRADLVDLEILSLMKKAGCKEISFGVETGSEELRFEVINKKIKNDFYINAFDTCKKLGIKTSAFFMLGFPKETNDDINKTIDFIFRLNPDVFGLHITVLFSDSDLFNIALKEHKVKLNAWDSYISGKSGFPFYIPDGASFERLNQIRSYVYRRFYLRPSFLFKHFFKEFLKKPNISEIVTFISILFKGRTSTGRP